MQDGLFTMKYTVKRLYFSYYNHVTVPLLLLLLLLTLLLLLLLKIDIIYIIDTRTDITYKLE